MFDKVESFKPASSRQQSAEIFVVCQHFIAPDKIDPRLLDPKFAFKQVELLQPVPDVLHKKVKQKRNRQGYDDNVGQGMFKSCSIASFVECENTEHLQMLGAYNEMKFTDTNALKYKNHKLTTTEVLEYFDDLKLLGRSVSNSKRKRACIAYMEALWLTFLLNLPLSNLFHYHRLVLLSLKTPKHVIF